MQNAVMGDNTYTADDITTVNFIGASGVLNEHTLEVSGLKGEKGDKNDNSQEPGPPGPAATTVVKAPDLSGTVIAYNTPSALAFANALGQEDTDGVLTITAGGLISQQIMRPPVHLGVGQRSSTTT